MNTQTCMEAAMFAASHSYSVGIYETGECAEMEVGDELRFVELRREALLQEAA